MVTSNRQVTVSFTGDVQLQSNQTAAGNPLSPGAETLVSLSTGNNAVSVPAGATAVTIVKPPGNAVALKLKGVSGDTGVTLNLSDPDSISLDPSTTTFVLNAGAAVSVRLIWS